MPTQIREIYEFGHFRLLPAEHQLLRTAEAADGNGSQSNVWTPVPLPPKVFDTLVVLVTSGGRLIEKDELFKQLWPDSFVEEVALAHNISHLRKALRNGSNDTFIETVPRRGYRFLPTVRRVVDLETPADRPALLDARSSPVDAAPVSNRAFPWKRPMLWVSVAIVVVAASALVMVRPARVPRVARLRPITNSGRVEPWGRIVTDGSRIYFLERYGDRWRAMQAPVAGGPAQPISWSLPGRNFRVLDVSPNGSQFLAGTFDETEEEMPLWVEPAVGGPPERLGNVWARDAAWAPDGQQIVFSHERGIFAVDRSGQERRLATVRGYAQWFSWSPDGGRLRFSVLDPSTYQVSLWEMTSDGVGPHPLPSVNPGAWGQWSRDGRYFLFSSTRDGQQNLWAQEGDNPHLFQLTAGPNEYAGGVFTHDGQAILVPVGEPKVDTVRYERGSRRFLPFMPGMKVIEMTFSRDGQWMVYTSSGLWGSRVDGSERRELAATNAPGYAPRISPDATRVAFTDLRATGALGIYVASLSTGDRKPVFADQLSRPDWSPDGRRIICNSVAPIAPAQRTALYIGDVDTGDLVIVPGSEGLRAARWSPDGRYLSALEWSSAGPRKLKLFDFRTGQWRELGLARYPTIPEWSQDGRYLYFQDLLDDGEPIVRIDIATAKAERIVVFSDVLGSRVLRAAFLALAPREEPIVSVTRNIADIHLLQLEK